MSYHEYKTGQRIELQQHPFYALIQAAMRQADNENQDKLAAAWPEIWQELQARYKAPGGALPGETSEELPEGMTF